MRSRTICGSALAGATAFWVTNLAISLTPLAADYRAALSISYVPMLVEAAIGGIVIGLLVSQTLARVPGRVPGREPLTKALVLGLGVLMVVTVLVELPAKLLASVEAPVHYLVVATAFNVLRILALAVVIGVLPPRVHSAGRRGEFTAHDDN